MGKNSITEYYRKTILCQVSKLLQLLIFYLIASDSNGVLIGEKDFEFVPKKWYFLGIEHDKPYLSRAQLSAFIDDKHVVKFLPVDYPKFDKTAKLNMVSLCKNFVG